jgi:putative heme-binding domain-containing protein
LIGKGEPDINRELARLLAILEDDDAPTLDRITTWFKADSDPVEDIHYLIVTSRLRAARSKDMTSRVASALLALDEKISKRKLTRDNNWPLRMTELHRELAKKDAALNDALLSHKDFGRSDHVVWTHAPGLDRKKAARVFLARAARDRDFAWNAALVQLLGELPDGESVPLLRRLWDEAGLNDVILPLLARRPTAEDRDKFLAGLASPSLAVASQSLAALEKLNPRKDADTLVALVRALRLLPDGKEEDRLRTAFGAYLGRLTGEKLPATDKQAWTDWLKRTHPKEAAGLGGEDGVDAEAWAKRLAGVDWKSGDVERGKVVFTRASCAACHSGSQAMGPDLQGVAGRFSRDDLFTAVVRPSKDVSARYRTTVLTTDEGKSYQGMIVYEAVDSVLVQTGPATMVRLTEKQITDKRVSPLSLMPTGLLDRLADRELADLYAYLKSLAPARPPEP